MSKFLDLEGLERYTYHVKNGLNTIYNNVLEITTEHKTSSLSTWTILFIFSYSHRNKSEAETLF